jgi:hypothetical protein
MKIKFICCLLFLSVSISYAQMSITTLERSDPILDGDVFEFDTNIFEDAKLKFVLANTSSTESIQIKIEVVSFTNTDGTNLQLCVQPLCFFSIIVGDTYPNDPIILGPGEDNGVFDYFVNTNPGDGVNYPMEYVLRFFTLNNNGDEVGDDITITYLYDPDPLSTSGFQLSDLGIELENTRVNQQISISSSTPAKMEVFNVLGKSLSLFEIGVGYNTFNMSDVSTGLLIAVFTSNDGRRAVTKLVKL